MEDAKKGFRVVTNPNAPERDLKVFPAEGASGRDVELMLEMETSKEGALLYGVADYPALVLLLNNTDGLKDVPTVRFCAGGRGYVKYERSGGSFPPEDAVRRTLESAPALHRPSPLEPYAGRRTWTIHQDAEHPEGVVRQGGPSDVDRFIAAYMRLGGTFPGLVDAMEEVSKWTSSTR